jgi:glycosyltransferase involved in cell wall biosynthesis
VNIKVGIISPIASQDGIGNYADNLYSGLHTDAAVDIIFLAPRDYTSAYIWAASDLIRCWDRRQIDHTDLLRTVIEFNCTVVHIHYHESFFYWHSLLDLINQLTAQNIKIVFTVHSLAGSDLSSTNSINTLRKLDYVQVHNQQDYTKLTDLGLKKLELWPIPCWEVVTTLQSKLRAQLEIPKRELILASHGFASPNKGLNQIAYAVAELKKKYPTILWIAAHALNPSNPDSLRTIAVLIRVIKELDIANNTLLVTHFPSDMQVISLIRTADIGVMAYADVGEAASAAVRKFLAAGIPSVITDIPQLQEFADLMVMVPSNDSTSLVAGIEQAKQELAQGWQPTKYIDYSQARSWQAAVNKLGSLYLKLVS